MAPSTDIVLPTADLQLRAGRPASYMGAGQAERRALRGFADRPSASSPPSPLITLHHRPIAALSPTHSQLWPAADRRHVEHNPRLLRQPASRRDRAGTTHRCRRLQTVTDGCGRLHSVTSKPWRSSRQTTVHRRSTSFLQPLPVATSRASCRFLPTPPTLHRSPTRPSPSARRVPTAHPSPRP